MLLSEWGAFKGPRDWWGPFGDQMWFWTRELHVVWLRPAFSVPIGDILPYKNNTVGYSEWVVLTINKNRRFLWKVPCWWTHSGPCHQVTLLLHSAHLSEPLNCGTNRRPAGNSESLRQVHKVLQILLKHWNTVAAGDTYLAFICRQ